MDMSTGIVCPMTKLDWENAARASNCSTEGEYHCLKNEKGKHTKKCIRKVWVQKEMCPEYNTKADKIDVDKCLAEREDCPSETYWSDEVYKYPKCLELSVMKTTFPTTSVAMTQHPTSKQPDTDSNITQPIIIAAVSSVVVFIIIALLIYFCIVKRRKHKKKDHVSATCDGERLTDTHEAIKLLQEKGIETQQPKNDRDVNIAESKPIRGQQRRIDRDKNVKEEKGIETQQPKNDRDVNIADYTRSTNVRRGEEKHTNVSTKSMPFESGRRRGSSYLDGYDKYLDSSRQFLNQNTGGAVHYN